MFFVLAVGIPEKKRKLLSESFKDIPDVHLSFSSTLEDIPSFVPDLIVLGTLQLSAISVIKSRFLKTPVILWTDSQPLSQLVDIIKDSTYSELLQEKRELEHLLNETKNLLDQRTSELAQKRRELRCLFQIATLRERPNISLEEIAQGITEIIPSAMRAYDRMCIRILLGYNEFKSKNFRFTPWKYTSDIIINGEWGGRIEVYYFSKPEAFVEKELIDAISERLGRIAERFRTEESLRLESKNI